MKRLALVLFLYLAAVGQACGEDFEHYTRNVLASTLVPGFAQLAEGDYVSGLGYLSVTPLLYGGYGLLFWNSSELADGGLDWRFDLGLLSVKAAETVQFHGIWSYFRAYQDAKNPTPRRRGRESLRALMAAPFDPAVVFSYDVFPVIPLTTVLAFSPEDWLEVPRYFEQERVEFYGMSLSPWLVAAVNLGYFAVLNDFVAVSEELAYRGISLEQNGLVYSSLVFGLVHASNLLFLEASPENLAAVAQQVAGATLIGFYNGIITRRNDYDIRKAVAIHYWNNVLNMFIASLVSPRAGGDGAASFAPVSVPLLTIRL
jgi:membrane protease YdiL (CAAX protease family)